MIYVLLWLLIGNIAYSFALTLRLYELGSKSGVYETKMETPAFILGLSSILLGPLAFALILFCK